MTLDYGNAYVEKYLTGACGESGEPVPWRELAGGGSSSNSSSDDDDDDK